MHSTSLLTSRGVSSWQYLTIIALFMILSGCSVNLSLPGNTSSTSSCTGNCTTGPGVQGVHVFVEPDAGEHPITDAISAAKKSVWIELYLLTDRNVIRALEEAPNRGVDVRVMLEPHPFGSAPPTRTMDQLRAAGAKVQDSNPSFALTHNGYDYRWRHCLYHDIEFLSCSPW